MNRTRVIPVLMLRDRGLVKTVRFRDGRYVGDPINAVRVFNQKEVDELVFLDIQATAEGRGPDFDLLQDIAGEAFMPMAYGGGVTTVEQAQRICSLGFEKVVIGSAAHRRPELIGQVAATVGSSSVVGCIDVRRTLLGRYEVHAAAGKERQAIAVVDHAQRLELAGAGEILVNSIDRDGTESGYDLKLIRLVSESVRVPVIACGGARGLDDFADAVEKGGASAVAAGSFFIFVGPHRAVLINYPERRLLAERLP